MDKHICIADSPCLVINSFWNIILKPISECCTNNLPDSIEKLTNAVQTTTDGQDTLAIYLELHQNAIISVERFSLLIAGILMLVATLILILGTCYMTCFHDEKFNYSSVPQMDFLDEGIRDLESLIQILSEIGHPLHRMVKHLATELEEFKSKPPATEM